MSRIGNRHRCGYKPWNFGTKGLVKPNSGSIKKGEHRSSATEFKRRTLPTYDIGTIRTRTHRGVRRNFIKVSAPNKWVQNAVHVWTIINGNVPTGYVIHHKDRNPLNDDITNLQLMTRAEHALEHMTDSNKRAFMSTRKATQNGQQTLFKG